MSPATARGARLVVVSAGLGDPSTSRMLADRLARATASRLAQLSVAAAVDVVELGEHAQDVTTRLVTGFSTPALQDALDQVRRADGLVLVTPIYTTSYSGLFKSFLDVLEPDALVGMPVVVGATGGSERHSLAIDYAIRPVLAYLRAATVPTGVYAATSDWGSGDEARQAGLAKRVERAAAELAGLVAATAGTRDVGDPFALPAGFDPSGGRGATRPAGDDTRSDALAGVPGMSGVTLGIDTFGDVTSDGQGRALSQAEVIRDIVAEGVLADQVGLEHFGVGEHHRDDFAVSAPEVVLAAVAARTSAVRLSSSVTVLSSDDPVRVYQRFATLDAVSGGRAEMIVGRGSFTESFPLFGYDLADYDRLFEEKLDLLTLLRAEVPVTWSGTVRGPLDDISVYPTTAAGGLPVWVGVGGSPESVVRTARHGLPMMLAIIGGEPARFRPYAELYRRETQRAGRPDLPLGVHSGGFVAATDDDARELHYPYYRAAIDRIGRERGWPPLTPQRYLADVERGSLYVGSPDTVAARIAHTVHTLGAQRFDLKYSAGALPHSALMSSIELFGTEVAPRVRQLLGAEQDARSA